MQFVVIVPFVDLRYALKMIDTLFPTAIAAEYLRHDQRSASHPANYANVTGCPLIMKWQFQGRRRVSIFGGGGGGGGGQWLKR